MSEVMKTAGPCQSRRGRPSQWWEQHVQRRRAWECVGCWEHSVWRSGEADEPGEAGRERPHFSIRNGVIRFALEKDLCINVGHGLGVAGRPTSCNNFDSNS